MHQGILAEFLDGESETEKLEDPKNSSIPGK